MLSHENKSEDCLSYAFCAATLHRTRKKEKSEKNVKEELVGEMRGLERSCVLQRELEV